MNYSDAQKTITFAPTLSQTNKNNNINTITSYKNNITATPFVNPALKTAKPQTNTKPHTIGKPQTTAKPQIVGKPQTTAKPQIVGKPQTTAKPQIIGKPKTTAKPQIVGKPKTTAKPQIVGKPKTTAKPKSSNANSRNVFG